MSAYYIDQARRLLAANDLPAALKSCQMAVENDEDDPQAWFMQATVQQALGNHLLARASALRALKINPGDARFWVLAGNAEQDLGDRAAARAAYARATELVPGWALAWHSLGGVCFEAGNLEDAEAAFERAVQADPAHVRSWNNLGHARFEQGRLLEAEAAFKRALALQPDYAHAFYNLARVSRARGDFGRAEKFARLACALDPRLVDAVLVLADLAKRRGDLQGARQLLDDLLGRDPGNVAARNELADVLAVMGQTTEAREQFRLAHQARPGNLRSGLGAALLLPPVYDSREDLYRWRNRYAEGLSSLEKTGSSLASSPRTALAREAQWTNFFLAYQGEEDVELQRRYGDFLATVLSGAFPEFYGSRQPRSSGSRIRVGFVSHFFFDGTIGRYFRSWITDLDRERFECRCYSTNALSDQVTKRIAAACFAFRECSALPLQKLASVIAEDDLDVLIYPELGMHGRTFALASFRLAPVQACAWGHPVTSGHANVDRYLSVEGMEPHGAQGSYTERLHLMPSLGTRYETQPPVARQAPESLGLPEGRHLYLMPHSLFKIHPDNDLIIANIFDSDPRGHLVFFADPNPAITRSFIDRIGRATGRGAQGVAERSTMLPHMSHPHYLQINAACGVMLDTLHWSGGNASLDALSCGLPIVTLPGRFMRGRQSAGMLQLLGLEELIASDQDDYVRKAMEIASDSEHRIGFSRLLDERRTALFDRNDAIDALQHFLEEAAS